MLAASAPKWPQYFCPCLLLTKLPIIVWIWWIIWCVIFAVLISTFGTKSKFFDILFLFNWFCFFTSKIYKYYLLCRTQVSICLNYCNQIFNECKTAEYGGFTIEDYYKNGREFCEAQDFHVVHSNEQCFDFDSTPFSRSIHLKQNLYLFYLIYIFNSLIAIIK